MPIRKGFKAPEFDTMTLPANAAGQSFVRPDFAATPWITLP
jgi:hypothetical protein